MSKGYEHEVRVDDDKVVITKPVAYGATVVWTITPIDYDLHVHVEYLNSKGESQQDNIGIRPIDTSNVVLFI